jgi:hypothetical protein
MEYKYRERVLSELASHGVIPRSDTPPELVHEFVNSIYLIEIRALKHKMLCGEILKVDYSGSVEQLRNRYPLLSLPVRYWIENE